MHRFRSFLLPVLICALLCMGIPTAMIATGHTELLRSAVSTVMTPVQHVFSDAGRKIRGFTAHFTEYDELKAENERLRAQIVSMETQVRDAQQTLDENAYLTQFLELKENHADYRFLKCEVVSAKDTGYTLTLTLNAGENEGAAVGYPVITAAGVVGRITEVGSNWSKVTPLTELSSSVGAYNERTGEDGVAVGDYACRVNGELLLSYLDVRSGVAVGDRIRTSGVGGSFPRGLLIGTVSEVRWDPATMARTAVLTPAASSPADLRDVMILTDFAVYEEDFIPDAG